MKVTFLGTGTSVGIPTIGCSCSVCHSSDPRNRRRRTSIYVESENTKVVVDTPPDFREQALAYKIMRVDAVLFTHGHADHIFGFDDIRSYNVIQKQVIPAYATASTLSDVKRAFDYVGPDGEDGVYRPLIDFIAIEGRFEVGDLFIEPLHVEHGAKPTCGFLFEQGGRSFAYIPDCSRMQDSVVDRLRGIDVMILDGLRHKPHKTHLTVAQALELLERIGAGKSYLTHMTHDLDHAATERDLPETVRLSYDGLVVDW